jgi:hypothetical protein
LAAEFITAACLIASGTALLCRKAWGRSFYLVAAGMLAHTVIVSPGYCAQRGQWPLVLMFTALLALDRVSIAILLRSPSKA